jgi:hypothetical protein
MFFVPKYGLVKYEPYVKNCTYIKDQEERWAVVKVVIPEIVSAGIPLDIPDWAMERGPGFNKDIERLCSYTTLPIKNSQEYTVAIWPEKDGGAGWVLDQAMPFGPEWEHWWWWRYVEQTPTPES